MMNELNVSKNLGSILQENIVNPIKKKFFSLEQRHDDTQQRLMQLSEQNQTLKKWLLIISILCFVDLFLTVFILFHA